MRRVLATLVALSLVMSMFTGVFAPVPEARAAGPAPVVLGTAGNFAILAKTAVTTTGVTHVTGDIGISPNAASFITGFALVAPPTTFTTSALVTGNVYAADYDPPTPTTMTTAIGDMQTAYTDAAGRAAGVGPNLNLGAGTVAGQTLAPGTYTWGSNVTITTDLTLSGSANDVWLFQITGTLDIATGKQILLVGGALAKNIFWQVSDAVTFYPGSHFEGIILAQTNIAMQTGATLNGRALAQTAVTLDANIVVAPTSVGAVTGTIIVDKVTIPSGDPQLFEFDPSWSLTGFSLADATTPYDSGPLVPGTYSVAEIIPAGWTQTSAVASDGSPVTALSLQAGETITVTFTNTFTSSATTPGDVDGDGSVTMADALVTAHAAVGITTLTGNAFLAADVNHDGFITMMDVLLVARIAEGISG